MKNTVTAWSTVLLISPHEEDHVSLRKILRRPTWTLHQTYTFDEGCRVLGHAPVKAVITEKRLSESHGWKQLLSQVREMKPAPRLIVIDRLADESLWTEVLNLGGYDLLLKPFDAKEVLHSVIGACRGSKPESRVSAKPIRR